MENLVKLLLTLVKGAPFNAESDANEAMDQLREFADSVGVEGIVPPAPVDQPAPAAPAPSVDPGPVAEPVPAQEQVPPPTSPEVAGATPEATNAFTQPPA
jgi:hypothetical protein